jgi:nucleoside-diphosphate-sugar epimerase
MRVLVTGGSGFIGTNLVEHFRMRGDRVVNLDIAAPRHPDHGACWQCVDLLDASSLRQAVVDITPDLVFHMAARTDLEGRRVEDYPANTQGVENLIDALSRVSSPRLTIFASSMLVCRIGYQPQSETDYAPSTAYGESKVQGERLVRDSAGFMPWVIVRPTSIWGPWFGSPYRDFFTAIQRGLYIHPRGRRIHRSYGFVLNVVHQLERLAEMGGGPLLGRTVYLADYEPVELRAWAEEIRKALSASPVWEVPLGFLRTGAWIGEGLRSLGWPRPPLTTFRLNNLLTEMVHDTELIHGVVGESPYGLEEAVRLTVAWMKDNSPRS